MVALKSIARRILRLDGTEVPLISQPQLELFSGKNFIKPNAFNPLRAAPVLTRLNCLPVSRSSTAFIG
jgi:hypothetical protein